MLTSCTKISWHSKRSLQSNFTATLEALVPFTFWYTIPRIFTAEACILCYQIINMDYRYWQVRRRYEISDKRALPDLGMVFPDHSNVGL